MENLQAVIDRHMEDAQTIWADDMEMKEMAIQDAVDAFVIKMNIKNGDIAEAHLHFAKLDTAPMEQIAVALEKDKGREWTEKTFGIEFA